MQHNDQAERAASCPAADQAAAEVDGKPADQGEAEALFLAHLHLVRVTLRRMGLARRSYADDLRAAGTWGLYKAAELWREDGGATFRNFAITSIRRHVLRELQRSDLIRVPADPVGAERAELRRKLRAGPLPVSRCDDCGECLLVDRRGDGSAERERHEAIDQALRCLDARSAAVLRLRFLDGQSQEDVGDQLGISRERVRQVEHEALRQLRRRAPELADLIAA